MRIIQALGWYFPEQMGGTEVYVAGVAKRLRAGGHSVAVVAPDAATKIERKYFHDHVPVYRYPIPSQPSREECQELVPVRGAERFRAWLAAERPDVVHFHTFVTGLGMWELRAAKTIGARVIATTHAASLGYVCQRGTMMRWGEKLCDGICRPAKCSACVLQHRGLAKPLAWAVGAIPPRVARIAAVLPGRLSTGLGMSDLIVRNQAKQREMLALVDKFVLLTHWAVEAAASNGARREKLALNRLGHSHEPLERKPDPETQPAKPPITVGYLGRFESVKGVYDLARALASLAPDLPIRVEFRGPISTDAEQYVVTRLKQLLHPDPRVSFAPAVSRGEVCRVLARYDVLCCPSVCLEGGPTVAIEAHAVGTPVVGTRIGGLAEMVSDGLNGRLVPPGDWQALARVLREMAMDPAGTIDRWRHALPAVRTMDRVAEDYLELYQGRA